MYVFIFFTIAGFFAQLIDGSLGMAYGISSNTILLGFGIPPAAASASTHAAEVFTTGVSGISHWKFGNIDRALFKKLVIPGIAGGVLGAYVLTILPGEKMRPFIAAYLFIMGLIIIWKALKKHEGRVINSHLFPLGLGGGFFDAVGGGGWGPIVTSTLLARGNNPRLTVGSVNAAEFFVTLAISLTFLMTIGFDYWKIIFGLLLGGVIAAPFAAYICKKLPIKPFMILVGSLIILLSMRILYQTLMR